MRSSKHAVKFSECLPHMKDMAEWTVCQDISDLRDFLLSDPQLPLITVSCGVSPLPLAYCAHLYSTHQSLAKAVTPLLFASLSDDVVRHSKVIILSDSGYGVDTFHTSRRAFRLNPKHTACITRPNDQNKLITRATSMGVRCFCYDYPDFGLKGLVNSLSLMAYTFMIYKAFTDDSDFTKTLRISTEPDRCFSYQPLAPGNELKPFVNYKHYIVLCAGYGEPVAIDFETKMAECRCASVQVRNYDSFMQGGFNFVNNNTDDTCIVLIRTPREKLFCDDLLPNDKVKGARMRSGFLPASLPIITIDTKFDGPIATIDLLVKEQVLFAEIAKAYDYTRFDSCTPKNASGSKTIRGLGNAALCNDFGKQYKVDDDERLESLIETPDLKDFFEKAEKAEERQENLQKKEKTYDPMIETTFDFHQPTRTINRPYGFEAVAGMDELKGQLRDEVLLPLNDPEAQQRYGMHPLNGMLLYGPPGCGKTFIAERFAEEAGMSSCFVKCSDLGSTYAHGTQQIMAQLFTQAEEHKPSVVCIDEIDALLSNRSQMSWSGYAMEVNEFLTQMNNCNERGIFVIGTTNSPHLLDPAVLRTGRFDEKIYVPLPDKEARKGIFQLKLSQTWTDATIDYDRLAALTANYVASDIGMIVNRAKLLAYKQHIPVSQSIIEQAVSVVKPSLSTKQLQQYQVGFAPENQRPQIGFATN